METFGMIAFLLIVLVAVAITAANVFKPKPPQFPFKMEIEKAGFSVSYVGTEKYVEGLSISDQSAGTFYHPYCWVIKNTAGEVVATFFLSATENEDKMVCFIAENCGESNRDLLIRTLKEGTGQKIE